MEQCVIEVMEGDVDELTAHGEKKLHGVREGGGTSTSAFPLLVKTSGGRERVVGRTWRVCARDEERERDEVRRVLSWKGEGEGKGGGVIRWWL